jgi:predicted PurR-regulated permease PerM
MQSPKAKIAAGEALVGMWKVSLTAFVIAALYFARDLLIPLALAGLLTFLLAPLVTRLSSAGSDASPPCFWWSRRSLA